MKRYGPEMKKKIVIANIQDGRTIASLASEYVYQPRPLITDTAKNAKQHLKQ